MAEVAQARVLSAVPYHHVIEQFDAENVARLDETPCQLDVGSRRCWIAARMVVNDHD